MATEIVNETPIKHLVEQAIINQGDVVDENTLLQEIVRWQKLDANSAEAVFKAMKTLGLEFCKTDRIHYSIHRFALMRGYFTLDEIEDLVTIRQNTGGHLR